MAAPTFTPPGVSALLRLAWPIVVSRSCQTVIGFTDAAMVARLGEEALAAGTTGSLNTFNFFILPIGAVQIVNSFASQFFGRGDLSGARRYAWYGLLLSAIVQALSFLAAPLAGTLLALFHFEPRVHAEMAGYMSIRLLSMGAATGLEALGAYYGGLGNTRLPMLANFGAMVLNVAFNWVLIFGNLGFPALGVRGAALASVAATLLAFAGLLVAFLRGVGVPGGRVPSRLARGEFGRMLRFGLPNGFNWWLEFSAFTFFVNFVMGGLGTTALAAMMASLQLFSVSFMPALGLSTAGAIFVGQAIGAGAPDVVPVIVRRTFGLAALWQGLVGIVCVSMPAALLSVFRDPKVEASNLIAVGAPMLATGAAWQIFDAAGITLTETLRAAGDTAFCLWARLVLAWLFFVPLSIFWARRLGGGPVEAVVCIVIYLAALAVAFYWRFRRGNWRRIDLTG
ncbi:MAG TPA: MATE family efflux transporter, partial [Planctomycetota bacterium]|nr:MATE family efflux transporter [Planctomycetota bacterium]